MKIDEHSAILEQILAAAATENPTDTIPLLLQNLRAANAADEQTISNNIENLQKSQGRIETLGNQIADLYAQLGSQTPVFQSAMTAKPTEETEIDPIEKFLNKSLEEK